MIGAFFSPKIREEVQRVSCNRGIPAGGAGKYGTVYQTLTWNHRGWHCASGKNGSVNNTHIRVEMCEPASIKSSQCLCANM